LITFAARNGFLDDTEQRLADGHGLSAAALTAHGRRGARFATVLTFVAVLTSVAVLTFVAMLTSVAVLAFVAALTFVTASGVTPVIPLGDDASITRTNFDARLCREFSWKWDGK
jgi:hypothetical protein